MKSFVNHWAPVSLALGVIVALVAALGPWGLTQRVLLGLIACLFLHFFEEFWWPGGFPYVGVKVMLGKDEPDPAKWNTNNLASLFGNWSIRLLIYVAALLLPQVRFLTLSAVLFSFLELFQHLIVFNVRLKRFYNPGLVTAVFGMVPIAIFYLLNSPDMALYAWYDYVIALVWAVVVFLFCFRSPLYWNLGKKDGFPFTPRAAFGPELKDANVRDAA